MLCGYGSRLLVAASGICAHKELAKTPSAAAAGLLEVPGWLVDPTPLLSKLAG